MPLPLAAAMAGWQGLSTLAHAGEETPEEQTKRLQSQTNPFTNMSLADRQKQAETIRNTMPGKGSGVVPGGQTGMGNAIVRAQQQQAASAPKPWQSSTGGGQPLSVPMPGNANAYDFSSFMQNSGGTGQNYSTPNQALISQYSTPSPEEAANRQGVTDTARLLSRNGSSLYNMSSPTFSRAMQYYGDILSGNKAAVAQAIAPEAEGISEITAGRQNAISTGSLRGGARDAALAEAGQAGAGQLAGLIPQARKDAAAAGGALGLQGINSGNQASATGGGLYQNLAGMGQQDRQFGVSAEQANRFQAAGLDQQDKQLQLSAMLGMRGLDLQQMQLAVNEKLQSRGMDIQEMLGMSSLNLQRELGLMGINLSQQQVDLLKTKMKNESEAVKGQSWADLGGILITGLGHILPSGNTGITGGSTLPINPLGAGLTSLAR